MSYTNITHNKLVIGQSLGRLVDDSIEKGRKNLVKKNIVDKKGRHTSVWVKPELVSSQHSHPSHLHAEAVSMYNRKRRYMSKENALKSVLRHYGREYYDYIRSGQTSNKKDVKSTVGKSVVIKLPDGRKVSGVIVRKHLSDIVPVQSRKDIINAKSRRFSVGLVHPDQLPPIIIDDNDMIIDGHHRYGAVKIAGLEYINVIVAKGDKFNLRINMSEEDKFLSGAMKLYDHLDSHLEKVSESMPPTTANMLFKDELSVKISRGRDMVKNRASVISNLGSEHVELAYSSTKDEIDSMHNKLLAFELIQKLDKNSYKQQSDYVEAKFKIWSEYNKESNNDVAYSMPTFTMLLQSNVGEVRGTKATVSSASSDVTQRIITTTNTMLEQSSRLISSMLGKKLLKKARGLNISSAISSDVETSFYTPSTRLVTLSSDALKLTVISHEIAHAIDHKIDIVKDCKRYMIANIKKDKPTTVKGLSTSHYKDHLFYNVKNDLFVDKYSSRYYDNEGTEVVSQFFTKFLRSPSEFLSNHKKHFDFVVNLLSK